MWHFVIIEIEYQQPYLLQSMVKTMLSRPVTEETKASAEKFGATIVYTEVPCWNVVHKKMIEYDELSSMKGPKDKIAFDACQSWIDQHKVEGSKYAIMKMFIV